jgi:hypothetical protein
MAPLAGLQPFSAASQVTDQGVLEAHGGPLDPSHGVPGAADTPTWPAGYGAGYDGTQYGPDTNQDGMSYDAGTGYPGNGDKTPSVHGAPYPRGIIQPDLETPGSYAQVADQLAVQRTTLHGTDLGAVGTHLRGIAGREEPANYTTDRYTAPNATNLAAVPGQLRQGKDTSQGYGQLNDNPEFQAGHSMRRVQHDTVHFDRTLEYAGPKPFPGKFPLSQGNFNGPDSPYGPVAGDTSTGQQIPWEGHIGDPTAYSQPVEPTVVQGSPSTGDAWAYYG